jgi:hypothetical protein
MISRFSAAHDHNLSMMPRIDDHGDLSVPPHSSYEAF